MPGFTPESTAADLFLASPSSCARTVPGSLTTTYKPFLTWELCQGLGLSGGPPAPPSLSLLPAITLPFTAIPPCFLPHSHLDNHSLWEPKVFAIRCFKIIMYSIQVRWLPGPACPPGQGHLWEQASALKEKASCPL